MFFRNSKNSLFLGMLYFTERFCGTSIPDIVAETLGILRILGIVDLFFPDLAFIELFA